MFTPAPQASFPESHAYSLDTSPALSDIVSMAWMMMAAGPLPTIRETIILTLIMGTITLIMGTIAERVVPPDRSALWNQRFRLAAIPVVVGIAYYVLPRFGLGESIPWAYRFGIMLILAVFGMVTLIWQHVLRQ